MQTERDAEGHAVLRHHAVGRFRDIVDPHHAFDAGDGDVVDVAGGEAIFRAQLFDGLDRRVRRDMAGITLDERGEDLVLAAEPMVRACMSVLSQ